MGVALSKKLTKPSPTERQQLAKLFPSTREGSSKLKRVFDPTSECVASDAHQKKKKSNAAGRATSREVVLMKAFRKYIPIKQN